jgi:hypothetical protein
MDGGQEAFFEPTWPWFRLTDMKPTNERGRLLRRRSLLDNPLSHGRQSLFIRDAAELSQIHYPDVP